MTEEPGSRSDLLVQLDAMVASWNEIISAIPETALESSDADWSIADVLSHLFGWRVLTVDRLEAAASNSGSPAFPWPEGMSEETDEGTDEINEYFRQTYRSCSLTNLIAASGDQFERIRGALATLTDEELLTPGRYEWLSGYPLSAVIEGVLEHFHVEHEAELRSLIGASGSERSSSVRTSIAPLLSVRRGKEAIAFYQAAFGAIERFRVEDESGSVVATLAVGEAEFWLADESPEHNNFSPETVGGGTVRMILTVDDPDAVFDRAVRAGAAVIWPVSDQYGWRVGRVVDPYGHHWEIGKPIAHHPGID